MNLKNIQKGWAGWDASDFKESKISPSFIHLPAKGTSRLLQPLAEANLMEDSKLVSDGITLQETNEHITYPTLVPAEVRNIIDPQKFGSSEHQLPKTSVVPLLLCRLNPQLETSRAHHLVDVHATWRAKIEKNIRKWSIFLGVS